MKLKIIKTVFVSAILHVASQIERRIFITLYTNVEMIDPLAS